MNTNQPISAARAAALLTALVPELARVELYPQWSDGTGEVVRRTRAVPYDAAGDIIEFPPVQQAEVSAVLRRIGDVDLDRPQWLNVATGEVAPVLPPVRPLWLSLGLASGETEWTPNGGHDADCAYVGGVGPCTCTADAGPGAACHGCGEDHAGDPDRCRNCTGCGTDHDPADCNYRPDVGALLEQRHQLEDPAEPPLGGAQPDQDFAASVAAGHVQPVDWGVCDPQSAPERDIEDVPVQGGAL